jgi:hypothetical protein
MIGMVKPQSAEKRNGNDMCYYVFGRDASCCHKMLKNMFTQNPLKHTPAENLTRASMLTPFLLWIQVVSMEAFQIGKFISIDEQTMGIKGMHVDKLWICYKKRMRKFLV